MIKIGNNKSVFQPHKTPAEILASKRKQSLIREATPKTPHLQHQHQLSSHISHRQIIAMQTMMQPNTHRDAVTTSAEPEFAAPL